MAKKKHKSKKKHKEDFDDIMDEYDSVMKDMVRKSRAHVHPHVHCAPGLVHAQHVHGHGHGNQVLWPEDKVLYMRELNRYRKLYVEMTELLRSAKKTFSKRAKAFSHKEKYFQKKIEAKEVNFAKVVDGLQSTFQSLKSSLTQAHEQITVLMQQRDDAKAECKKLQADVFFTQDENSKHVGVLGELEKQVPELKEEKNKLQEANQQFSQELFMANADLQNERAQNEWNVNRIRELEEAVEEIWNAQNNRANADNESLNQVYDELRHTSKELHNTQQQIASLTGILEQREAELERTKKAMELQQRELGSQKQTIATLNQLIQRLSTKKSMDEPS